jgi:hypothetical protein
MERQVKKNYACYSLVYAIITICKFYGLPYYQFSPLWKFTSIRQEYNTKGKAHKQLSVDNCAKFLYKYCDKAYVRFIGYKKKDDIADSINQGVIYGLLWNKYKVTLDEYKECVCPIAIGRTKWKDVAL